MKRTICTMVMIAAIGLSAAAMLDMAEARSKAASEAIEHMNETTHVYQEPAPEPEQLPVIVSGESEVTAVEMPEIRPGVPLTVEEQEALWQACREFGIPESLALGVIQKETNFQNITGDQGRSQGYMQIQRRWWKGLMAEIGASDLMEPEDNFRTGCAILAQLLEETNGDVPAALTMYNAGKDHGGRSYANEVLAYAEGWK